MSGRVVSRKLPIQMSLAGDVLVRDFNWIRQLASGDDDFDCEGFRRARLRKGEGEEKCDEQGSEKLPPHTDLDRRIEHHPVEAHFVARTARNNA
jgi:hypothetical protein